jgi:hypothetical protein
MRFEREKLLSGPCSDECIKSLGDTQIYHKLLQRRLREARPPYDKTPHQVQSHRTHNHGDESRSPDTLRTLALVLEEAATEDVFSGQPVGHSWYRRVVLTYTRVKHPVFPI